VKRLALLLLIAVAVTLVIPAYAGMDSSDKLSQNQSSVFSPGYINASKQKTDAIIYQQNKPKTFMENAMEYVNNKLGRKVTEDAVDKPVPELKKKTSQVSGDDKALMPTTTTTTETKLIDSTNYNVNIGMGTEQIYDNGRLISEVINETRHVYAGFDNVGKGTISEALDISNAGDFLIIKGKTFNEDMFVTRGIKIYGGYDESGLRDIEKTPTTINGSFIICGTTADSWGFLEGVKDTVEINGFNIHVPDSNIENWGMRNGGIIAFQSADVLIANNTFYAPKSYEYCVYADTSFLTVKNNNFERGIGIETATNFIDSSYYDGVEGDYWLNEELQRRATHITSMNNNYKDTQSAGIDEWSMSNVISTNDYFAGEQIAINPFNAREMTNSIINPSVQVNQQRLNTPISIIVESEIMNTGTISDYNLNQINKRAFNSLADGFSENMQFLNSKSTGLILAALIGDKNEFNKNNFSQQNLLIVNNIVENIVLQAALAIPANNVSNIREEYVGIALALQNIMRNPTADQKLILDTLQALLQDTEKAINESGTPELKKASDDLLQMVAAILIAQAIPDLLKEGDVSGIKGIFTELNTEKSRILLQYQDSTKLYYNEMIKELSKNMDILQLKDIISGKLSRDDLERIPRNELDKIVEKLRQAKDKSFETEYLLQEEAKLRKAYIDPNKRVMEENMKDMMNGFTKRLSKILEATKK